MMKGGAAMLMKARAQVDFFEVEQKHMAIHGRLENWASWCYSSGGSGVSPMFRLYRPDNYERVESLRVIDTLDAARVAKGVAQLPALHRGALTWSYILRSTPKQACKKLGTTIDGLALLVRDGRTMLVNRNV